jgi:RHS repeat-associated protein
MPAESPLAKRVTIAYGETRLTTGTIYTDKLFTGQREMAGLGIYSYGARFYSQKLGRFLSADSMVTNLFNPQGLNRFSYVWNNPLRYTDPTGHMVANEDGGGVACTVTHTCTQPCSTCGGGGGGNNEPESVDNLTSSGTTGYETYLELYYDPTGWWWTDSNLGGDGQFTINDFVTMNYYEEGGDYINSPNFAAWQEALVRNYYTWAQAMPSQYTSGDAGLLNFIYAQAGPKTRTGPANFDGGFDPSTGIPVMQDFLNIMIDPVGSGHGDWANGCIVDAPCHVGSHAPGSADLLYIRTFINSGCQPSFLVDPTNSCDFDKSFLFILDAADSNYWDDIVDP